MKKIVLSIFVFVMLGAYFSPIYASEKSLSESSPAEQKDLVETIKILEDPKRSQMLAQDLRKLLKAREELQNKESISNTEQFLASVNSLYDDLFLQIGEFSEKLEADIRKIPSIIKNVKIYFVSGNNLNKHLPSLALLFFLFLTGVIVRSLIAGYTYRLQDKLKDKVKKDKFGMKLYAFMATFGLRFLAELSLFGFLIAGFLLSNFSRSVISLGTSILMALIIYSFASNFLYALFVPDKPESRLVPLGDKAAERFFGYIKDIALFSLFAYIAYSVVGFFELPAVLNVVSSAYKIILFFILAFLLFYWRKSIQQLLFLGTSNDDPQWVRQTKKIFNYIARYIVWIVTLYLAVLITVSISGADQVFSFMLSTTVTSILLVAGAVVVAVLWDYLFRQFVSSKEEISGEGEFAGLVHTYLRFLKKAGYFGIAFLTVLTLVDLWGVDIYGSNLFTNVIIGKLFQVTLLVIAAIVSIHLAGIVIKNLQERTVERLSSSGKVSYTEARKRASTLGSIINKALLIVVLAVVGMMILSELGFDIKPILGGVGILGVAIGFGSQSLVKDIISGLFLIFENRLRVGDVAVINGSGGLVEQVNLRTTILRGLDGTVHVIPNGTISTLSNMTHEFSYYLFELGVAYKEDTDRVISVIKELGEELREDEKFSPSILEPLEVLGVDAFADSAVIIKFRIKTAPIQQWSVGREMKRRIKKRFDEEGIEIPFPHRTFYFGEESKSVSLKVDEENRNEIRKMIQEVLRAKK